MGIPIWKGVKGYEGLYEVSDTGLVKSLFRYKKILKPNKMNTGYLSVELFKNGTSKRMSIHRLVAEAFIPNPNNYPQVNHKDENKQNNNVENLEWCTAKYNLNYNNGQILRHSKIDYSTEERKKIARKNGKAAKKAIIQFSKENEYIAEYENIKQASVKLKINASHISETCKGKRKSAGGYVWRYKKGE